MNVSVGAGIKNKFTFVVEDIKTKEKREYTAHNIVLDTMWSRLVNFQPFFVNIHFGTGTGAFNDKTRTGLYTFLGTKAATTEFQTRALPTSTWRRKIVLNPEEYVGQTITEVGVAYGSSASNLVTHAAPKDSEGNPIAIGPKKDTEIITIYADMYFVLAENMYGGKIKWVTPLENNELLTYLMGGGFPTVQFRVTQSRTQEYDGVIPMNNGQGSNILPSNWIKDATNKKAITPVSRLGATIGNGYLRGFGIGSSDATGVFKGLLPITGVFEQYAVTDEIIGTGDGVVSGFNTSLGSLHKTMPNITLYSNGIEIDESDYDINYWVPPDRNVAPYIENASISISGYNPYDVLVGAQVAGVNPSISIELPEPIVQLGVVAFGIEATNTNTQIEIKSRANEADEWSPLLDYTSIPMAYYEQDLPSPLPSNHKFMLITLKRSGTTYFKNLKLLTDPNAKIITFHTPPPAGSVITADYTVDYIPKDEFHVLDLQAGIQYGEVV